MRARRHARRVLNNISTGIGVLPEHADARISEISSSSIAHDDLNAQGLAPAAVSRAAAVFMDREASPWDRLHETRRPVVSFSISSSFGPSRDSHGPDAVRIHSKSHKKPPSAMILGNDASE